MSHLNDNTLVLNRLWTAVNICAARDAYTLMFKTAVTKMVDRTGEEKDVIVPHAKAIIKEESGYQIYDFQEWMLYSDDWMEKLGALSEAEQAAQLERETIGLVKGRIRIPRVVLLTLYDKLPHKEVRFTRHSVYERDRYTCGYCNHRFGKSGVHHLNLDHVIPRERGGTTTWENIITACIPCNTKKANRTPSESGMKLLWTPTRPKWRTFVNMPVEKIAHEQWSDFMDFVNWKVEITGHSNSNP